MVIGHHLMFTGYGHWLPNDPRGSLSLRVWSPELAELAQAHFGRRNPQPSLEELKAFYARADGLLAYPVLWFDAPQREALIDAVASVVQRERLTCWACAVLSNHVHVLVRRHRLKGDQMHARIREACVETLRERCLVPPDHPVLSARACDVFKDDVLSVRTCVRYINDNFARHRLPLEVYPFVKPYDDWPFQGQITSKQ